jgi:hypothetical protein
MKNDCVMLLGSPPLQGSAAAVAELERVVQSPAFGGSTRQIRLLRFLVGEVLARRGGELRAPVIATRFFERPEGFDTAEDSIVRVEISKLRRALARHYAVAPASALQIELPRGSYAPVFTAVAESDEGAALDPPPPGSGKRAAAGSPALAPAREDGAVLAIVPFTAINAVSTMALRVPAPGAEPPPGATGTRSRSFAHGLTDRLGDLFACSPGVHLVSHAVSLEDAASRGARYVLEGCVRLIPGALRVAAKLHDTRRGMQVWGSTYDRMDAEDRLFAVEDEIAHEITRHLAVLPTGAVHAIEAEERAGHSMGSAYEVALRFPRWLGTFDPRLQAEIKQACATLAEDTGLMAYSAFFHTLSTWTAGGDDHDRRLGAEQARRAVMVEPKQASSHQALAFALLDAGDGRGALAEADLALSLGGPLMLTGMVLALAGDWARGVSVLRAHLAGLKRYPGGIRHVFFLDAYRRGDHAAALAEAETIATPHLAWDPLDRAVALARVGRIVEACAAGRALTAILPGISRDPRAFAARMTADAGLVDDLVEALSLAGVG